MTGLRSETVFRMYCHSCGNIHPYRIAESVKGTFDFTSETEITLTTVFVCKTCGKEVVQTECFERGYTDEEMPE